MPEYNLCDACGRQIIYEIKNFEDRGKYCSEICAKDGMNLKMKKQLDEIFKEPVNIKEELLDEFADKMAQDDSPIQDQLEQRRTNAGETSENEKEGI